MSHRRLRTCAMFGGAVAIGAASIVVPATATDVHKLRHDIPKTCKQRYNACLEGDKSGKGPGVRGWSTQGDGVEPQAFGARNQAGAIHAFRMG